MIHQPEWGSRNVNELFYESEGRNIDRMNKVIGDIRLTRSEEKTMVWLAGWESEVVRDVLSVMDKVVEERAKERVRYDRNENLNLRKSKKDLGI